MQETAYLAKDKDMTENTKAKPAYEAFVVDETGKSTQWTKVGAAGNHEDGKGINLTLVHGLSVSGKLVLRPPDSERKSKRADQD
jgi:hypothetical protein